MDKHRETVYALIPVFNRLNMTRNLIEQLRGQLCDARLEIVVVDDGSTDGTAEYLRANEDIRALTGNGSLFWGGAIDLGLRDILQRADESDWVLFFNNDTSVRPDYVQKMLEAARRYSPCAVGSIVRDVLPPHTVLEVATRIDLKRLEVEAITPNDAEGQKVIATDLLSGRGTLYPVNALKEVGGMRPGLLPHYFGDYELSVRVRKHGWNLLVASETAVYSANEFGSGRRERRFFTRIVSIRSPTYFPALVTFWWEASSLYQRILLPARLLRLFWRRNVSRSTREAAT